MTGGFRAPKDQTNIRILQTVISGIPLILGLGTKMSDPYVYVVFWAPSCRKFQIGDLKGQLPPILLL